VVEEEKKDKDGMGPHDGQPRNAQYMAGFHARQQVIDIYIFSSSLFFPVFEAYIFYQFFCSFK